MRYLFFINPAAGKGILQKTLLNEIRSYFDKNPADYKIFVTRFPGDAEETARKEAQKGDSIRMFACGGEGTCYELINGIYGCDNVELGVIPCGSANDFLRYFGDVSPFRDIDSQLKGSSYDIDILKADDGKDIRYCINGCSVGMDAMVAHNMRIFKKLPFITGTFAYTLSVIKVFSNPKLGIDIDLTVDGENLGRRGCMFAVIANAPYYGGGYKGAPDAVPSDGQLDFTLVDRVSHFKVAKFANKYKRGEVKGEKFVHLKRCSKMKFISDREEVVNLDGEIFLRKSMEFSIVKKGVKFILPAGVNPALLQNCDKILKNI